MIRDVVPADAAAIAAIYNHYIVHTTISFEMEPISAETMRQRIVGCCSGGYPFLVCESAGQLVGYCYAHPWKERAAYAKTWEITIYLAPAACGAGIGKQMLHELITRCRAAGCRALIACITGGNVRSRRFHEQAGFQQVSHFEQVGEKLGHILDVDDFELLLN